MKRKNAVATMLMVLALVGCSGAEGPMGPAGPAGPHDAAGRSHVQRRVER